MQIRGIVGLAVAHIVKEIFPERHDVWGRFAQPGTGEAVGLGAAQVPSLCPLSANWAIQLIEPDGD